MLQFMKKKHLKKIQHFLQFLQKKNLQITDEF